ncbi:MAG TPA: bifunctional demethylmenaquinone methyltransferase/2-methoxy-6-polyprenyl-1,4-benzoquinol methylase UbiE [Gammaproteobacteria bacterium]|nr:bifunctional demethylmenaquinone methyltransferase/2-methoxy-6-polyprenyl-1,4-benzoquinol methylase UbiE [Gammaproteobacteria bacterium]
MQRDDTTDFGFEEIRAGEKQRRVGEVFTSVAQKYDLMNDLMSFGIHRLWKRFTLEMCALRPGHRVLDLAGGTGDLALGEARRVGDGGQVVLADINAEMLLRGRDRCIDHGLLGRVSAVQCNAEMLPFEDNHFDCITIAFGLRNVTDKGKALASMQRVLKPGGRLCVLEFSKPIYQSLEKLYDLYSFKLLPRMGEWVAGDPDSYRYLAESIRMHPNQATLKQIILDQGGFDEAEIYNLSGGIVALHRAFKY